MYIIFEIYFLVDAIPLSLYENEIAIPGGIRRDDGVMINPDEDLGEGEQFLQPEAEADFSHRHHVSRSQFFRYMSQIRGNDWKEEHWLWDWGPLAQLYVISYNNRMEAEKVQYLKRLQGKRRLIRVRALLEWVEKLKKNQGIFV